MKKAGHKDIRGGCFQCDYDSVALWFGPSAVTSARNHAKAKNHSTWVEMIKSTTYNPEAEFRKNAYSTGEMSPIPENKS